MTVFELMTGGDMENINQPSTCRKKTRTKLESTEEKIEFYSDYDLPYEDIAMPEIAVTVYYEDMDGKRLRELETKMKLGRVLRYQHLGRVFVDEDDYPQNQEYFLYADNQV